MKIKVIHLCIILLLCCAGIRAQEQAAAELFAAKQRVPLAAQAAALDEQGRVILTARLRTPTPNGMRTSSVENVRFVVENSSPSFYRIVAGWVTFYDAEGVRCGGALFTINALAPGEAAETDAPGLRFTCKPVAWRIVATSLVPGDVTGDVTSDRDKVKGGEGAPRLVPASNVALPPLIINIDGEVLPLQLGNPIEHNVGEKKIKIVVTAAP